MPGAASYRSALPAATVLAADAILSRRSAQHFNARFEMSAASFHRLLDSLLARTVCPFDVWRFTPRLHPVLFVHRVEGVPPGVYALPRSPQAERLMRRRLRGEFEPIVAANPWRYRQLHWEAGLLGQVLYLEADAVGLRGTGIGCFFDDDLHAMLGIKTRDLQELYQFIVGRPLTDDRITTLPA